MDNDHAGEVCEPVENGATFQVRPPNGTGAISCVVDADPRFHLDALRWFATLTRVVGVDPHDLVINLVGETHTDVTRYLAASGVNVESIKSFDPRSPHCNKISGAFALSLVEGLESCVLTDCDVVFFEDPRSIPVPLGQIAMQPVGGPNPPLRILEAIFDAAGIASPGLVELPWTPGEYTVSGNGNGGLYVASAPLLKDVVVAWGKWASWLLDRSELLETWTIFVDQVAMALALAAEDIGVFDLGARWNVPAHPGIAYGDWRPPAMIHYFQYVDNIGRLMATGVEAVDVGISAANAALSEVWGEMFPNASFWNWRYRTNPDLGSGIGSRGEPLVDKRRVLSEVLDIVHPESTLDIGCGDGEATADLSMASYVGLDVSEVAVQRASEGRPDGEYLVGSLADYHREADLTLCLDVLIHQSDPREYRDMVRRILSSARIAAFVSGYEDSSAAASAAGFIYYHEPLSKTVSILDPGTTTYCLRKEHGIASLLILKNPKEPDQASALRVARASEAELRFQMWTMRHETATLKQLLEETSQERSALSAHRSELTVMVERMNHDVEAGHAMSVEFDRLRAEANGWRQKLEELQRSRTFRYTMLLRTAYAALRRRMRSS